MRRLRLPSIAWCSRQYRKGNQQRLGPTALRWRILDPAARSAADRRAGKIIRVAGVARQTLLAQPQPDNELSARQIKCCPQQSEYRVKRPSGCHSVNTRAAVQVGGLWCALREKCGPMIRKRYNGQTRLLPGVDARHLVQHQPATARRSPLQMP